MKEFLVVLAFVVLGIGLAALGLGMGDKLGEEANGVSSQIENIYPEDASSLFTSGD